MSHRDRVLRQKERRREERGGQRQTGAVSLASLPLGGAAGTGSSTRDRSRTQADLPPAGGLTHSRPGASSHGRLADEQRHSNFVPGEHQDHPPAERFREVSWMLDYEHVQPANLAHPFESRNPKVVHSPRRRARVHGQEPSPPPLQYGHPPAPQRVAQPHGGSVYNTWRNAEGLPGLT
ncbi:unnamed protein product [Prorocentrum cordatum]|uniref:Uncharacterized protein n=1 Tax=Prorocentrum cordatum TaxID=2364126 RepID=A0ABN9U499_9DINO|nr:unnamed protein product [Polarella glacialis]